MVNSNTSYPNAGTGVGTQQADNHNHTFAKGVATRGPFAPVANTETLAAAKTIAITDSWHHRFTPTAARTVTMPATTNVGAWLIFNDASTAGRILTIADAAAATIGTIDVGQAAWVTCNGTSWAIARFNKGSDVLTDNSTGTASGTIAAGVGIVTLSFPVNLIGAVAAFDVVTELVLGYKFKILAWSFVTDVVGVGSGASRVFNMEIETTDVGTVPSTITVTEAGTDTRGEKTDGTAVSGANTGTEAQKFSIECANSGTAFTAGSGTIFVRVQNMDTADAIASLAARS